MSGMNYHQPTMSTQPQALLAALWQKNYPKILAHLDLLDQAATTTPLPAPLQKEAAAVAHKLAGSLGMYGYPAGTEAARQLEQELDLPTPNQSTLQQLTKTLRQSIPTSS